jgi:cell fate regulator YaaT (PSP1 superfamily)
MKFTNVDYQGDKSKATFYFTTKGHVDFRVLIMHLSEASQVLIVLRQTGIREEVIPIAGVCSCENFLYYHTRYTHLKPNISNFTIHLKSYFRGNALYR